MTELERRFHRPRSAPGHRARCPVPAVPPDCQQARPTASTFQDHTTCRHMTWLDRSIDRSTGRKQSEWTTGFDLSDGGTGPSQGTDGELSCSRWKGPPSPKAARRPSHQQGSAPLGVQAQRLAAEPANCKREQDGTSGQLATPRAVQSQDDRLKERMLDELLATSHQ
jgi:hypothetical protein